MIKIVRERPSNHDRIKKNREATKLLKLVVELVKLDTNSSQTSHKTSWNLTREAKKLFSQ